MLAATLGLSASLRPTLGIASQTGPVAAYSFDEGEGETVEDLTGDGHTATIEGAEWTTHGRYGGAMEFSRSANDYLTVPDSPELDFAEEFTLEAWVRPTDEYNQWSPVIVKQTGGGEGTYTYGFRLYDAGPEQNHPLGAIESAGEEEAVVNSPEGLSENAWSHIALAFDGAKLRLYVNGQLVDETASKAPVTTAGDLQIGGSTEHGDYFDGRIDEVRLYNRALGVGEIEPNQGPDGEPPVVFLTGTLTEGLKTGTTEYALHIHATDGSAGKRGVGVRKLQILVDAQIAQEVSQECLQTNCSLDYDWTFDTEVYGFAPHNITVSVEDQNGNVTETPLPLPVANGSIPACSLNGPQPESPPEEIEELAGGGTTAVYHGSEGETITFPSAPEGFDPSSATDSDLELYGFPPRPSGSETRAREVWNQTVSQTTGTGEPGGCMMTTSPGQGPAAATSFSPNHSAYFASNPSGPSNQWRGAQTEYVQPALTKTCGEESLTSTWVAVGGLSNEGFFQAGTNQPYGYYGENGRRLFNISSFIEFFRSDHGTRPIRDNEEPLHVNLKIRAGDRIFTEVIWKTAKKRMFFYVLDRSSKKHLSVEIELSDPESSIFSGRQLEFAGAERVPGGELANFESVSLVGNEGLVSGEGWTSLANLGHLFNSRMQEENSNAEPIGQVLASNSGLFSVQEGRRGAGFRTVWHHCHPARRNSH